MNWSNRILALFTGSIALAFAVVSSLALEVPAANGRAVSVVGIQNATPAGLEVQLKPDAGVRVVAWSQLDLEKLRQQLPEVHAAWQKTSKGETVALNLGTFKKAGSAPPEEEMVEGRIPRFKDDKAIAYERPFNQGDNYKDGLAVFAIPLSVKAVEAVVVVLWKDPSRGADWANPQNFFLLSHCEQRRWGVLGINLKHNAEDGPTYHNVSEGSGQIIQDSLEHFAKAFGQPEIATVPLFIAGGEGASGVFAYNYAQWKPERILAVATFEGTPYGAEPSPEGAKIPAIFFDRPAISLIDNNEGGARNFHATRRDKNLPWIYAEFPSRSDRTEWHLIKQLFDLAFKRQVSGGKIIPFDQEQGAQMGNLETHEIVPANDLNRADPGYVWLPDLAFAKEWAAFQEGVVPEVVPERIVPEQ